jgi:hypothetical protein
MANILRIVGAIGIILGLGLIALALAPLVQNGASVASFGSAFTTQAVAALAAGVVGLGLGQLISVNQRIADNTENLLDYLRNHDQEPAPAASSSRDVFANVPDYSPRRDPPIVKEGTYREHAVLTLEDGTVAVQTTSGWKRFRRIRDFEHLLTTSAREIHQRFQ